MVSRQFLLCAATLCSSTFFATTITVMNNGNAGAGTLRQAIQDANSMSVDTIDLSMIAGQTITLTSALPGLAPIAASLTFMNSGAAVTLNGNNFQGFSQATQTIAITGPINVTGCVSQGGNGGNGGGGGGIGAGPAIYVHTGSTMIISSMDFSANTAQGGNGGSPSSPGSQASGGGGGGYGGGAGGSNLSGTGGGGGGRSGGGGGGPQGGTPNGFDAVAPSGGQDLALAGGGGSGHTASYGSGGASGSGLAGGGAGANGAGGGGGMASTGSNGTAAGGGAGGAGIADGNYGGGGGGASIDMAGGDGTGDGGGGGAGSGASGGGTVAGNGGIDGGGGGGLGGLGATGAGGTGGFGGGGGGGPDIPSSSAFGGGNGGAGGGLAGPGGGGAAFGGAIFIQGGNGVGGQLTIEDGVTFGNSGANNLIGGTAGMLGILPASDGSTLGEDIFLRTGGSLTFNLTGSMILANAIDGGGASTDSGGTVVKTGSGSLTFSAANTYTQPTTVANGTLIVSGTGDATNTTITVNAGAVLKGTGTIGGSIIDLNGTIAPGTSIGTMFATGDTQLHGILSIEINPTMNSVLDGGGIGTITLDPVNSVLQIVADPGSYTIGQMYTIIDNMASVSGSFGPNPSYPAGMDFSIMYNLNSVVLTLIPFTPPPTPSSSGLNTGGLHGNSRKVANYLNSLPNGFLGSPFTALAALPLSQENQALQTISPSRNSFTSFAAANTVFSFSQMMRQQFGVQRTIWRAKTTEVAKIAMASLEGEELLAWIDMGKSKKLFAKNHSEKPPEESWNVWITGFGDFASQDKQRQNPAFDFTTGGVLAAFNYAFDRTVVGAALSYAHSNIDQDHHFGSGEVDGVYLALTAGTLIDDWFLEGAVWNSYQRIENNRHVFFPGFDHRAKSSHNGYQGDFHFAFGYDYETGPWTVEPFGSLDWAYLVEAEFKEKGAAPFNMNQKSHLSSMLRSEAGLSAYYEDLYDWGVCVFNGKLSYVNKAPFNTGRISAFIVGAPGSFTVTSFTTQNLVSPGAQVFIKGNNNIYGSLTYDGEFGSGYIFNQVVGTIGKTF